MRGQKYVTPTCPCGHAKQRLCRYVNRVTGDVTTDASQRTSKRRSRYNWTYRVHSAPRCSKIRRGNHTRKFNCYYCDVKAVHHPERHSDKKAGQYDFTVTHWVRKSRFGGESIR